MKLLTFFTAYLLVGLACTAPASNDAEENFVIDENFFPDSLAVYTSEHDIVSILVPLNALNFEENSDTEEKSDLNTTTFIVEADFNEKGERVDRGLYLLKAGHATKLLDNGRDAVATYDDTKTAYFAAKDGIYTYNAKDIKAEKYGSLTDSLINIAKVNGSDVFYVLTDDHVLYKVTEEGTKKEKIDTVVNAKQIVLDFQNVLYYYTTDNEVYALGSNGVKKIEGLPQNPTYVKIVRPPFILEEGVPVVVNSKSYIVYENGTSESTEFDFTVKPTAYSMEATLIHYYAYNKKVYEYNILALIITDLLSQFRNYFSDKTDIIQSIATRSRQEFVL